MKGHEEKAKSGHMLSLTAYEIESGHHREVGHLGQTMLSELGKPLQGTD